MQPRGNGIRLGDGLGTSAAGHPRAFRSFSERTGRQMSILDDIRVRVFCQSAIPDRTGPHAVGTARLKLSAPTRNRGAIVVQLWYPVEGAGATVHARGLSWLARLLHPAWAPVHHGAPLASTRAAFPFIAYVPDAPGHHDDNTFTLANMASHGFILAAIDNPYRNGKVDVGLPAEEAPHANGTTDAFAVYYANCVARGVETASALLDGLEALEPNGPGGDWAGRVDLKQAAILGYAMGGAVAAETVLADHRYRAAANLDGTGSGQAREVHVPYLMMLSDFSMPASRRPPPRASTETSEAPTRLGDYRRAQRQAALSESHIIEIAGTRREHFSDKLTFPSRLIAGCRQVPNCKRIRAIIDSYTVAFFTTYLDGEPHPLMCVRHSPYPEVRFITGADENDAWALREPAGRG